MEHTNYYYIIIVYFPILNVGNVVLLIKLNTFSSLFLYILAITSTTENFSDPLLESDLGNTDQQVRGPRFDS